MKTKLLIAAAVAALLPLQAPAKDSDDRDDHSGAITVAVFGDWPYNDLLLANSDRLIGSVNADRSVRAVIHVGDIHSGSQPCTSAGILPPLATSNPG